MAAPEEVDLGGDTNLVIGPEGSQIRVRVNKLLLEQTSEYFKALYSPKFSEGASASHCQDIALKDDDPQAMLVLLKILHHRYDSPKRPTTEELVGLAIVADKYACEKLLRSLADSFFPIHTELFDDQEVRDLAVAAYLLGDSARFAEYTKRLLLDSATSFSEHGMSAAGKLVPSDAWLILESRKTKYHTALAFNLLHLYQSPCPHPNCPRAERWCTSLRNHLQELGLSPFRVLEDISDFAELTRRITAPDVDLSLPTCPSPRTSHRTFDNLIEEFHEYMAAIEYLLRGICMVCLKAGMESAEVREACVHLSAE